MKKKNIVLQSNPYSEYIAARIRADKKEKELAEQKALDFQKWLESEYRKTDLSGIMPWCLFCKYSNEEHKCICDVKARAEERICVKAHKIMKEKLGK